MSFIGKLFGSDKALAKIVDTSKELLDEAFYTEQEAAESRAKAADKARGMIVEWVEASSGSRLARRLLALTITGTWLLMHVISTTMLIASIWSDPTIAGSLLGSAEILDARNAGMQGAVMLILGFYFAAPFMGDIAKGALNKFGGTDNQTK